MRAALWLAGLVLGFGDDRDCAIPFEHRKLDLYDAHTHNIELIADGWMSSIYESTRRSCVNSIHHQGIKRLGEDLVTEAISTDGVIEAIRHARLPFMVGVQWHPEFHDARFPDLLPSEPLLKAFLKAATERRAAG